MVLLLPIFVLPCHAPQLFMFIRYPQRPIMYKPKRPVAAKPVVAQYLLPFQRCTSVETQGGGVAWHRAVSGTCQAELQCTGQCRLVTPPELEDLCWMYVLATGYIAYLGYEFHRCLACDRARGWVLTGRLASVARAVTPLMRWLPDLSALAKYALAVAAIWQALAQPGSMVSCSGWSDRNGTWADGRRMRDEEVSGLVIQAGCGPDVGAALAVLKRWLFGASGAQVALFSAAIAVKQSLLWPRASSRLLAAFVAVQVAVVGIQVGAVVMMARLEPAFPCAGGLSHGGSPPPAPSLHGYGFGSIDAGPFLGAAAGTAGAPPLAVAAEAPSSCSTTGNASVCHANATDSGRAWLNVTLSTDLPFPPCEGSSDAAHLDPDQCQGWQRFYLSVSVDLSNWAEACAASAGGVAANLDPCGCGVKTLNDTDTGDGRRVGVECRNASITSM